MTIADPTEEAVDPGDSGRPAPERRSATGGALLGLAPLGATAGLLGAVLLVTQFAIPRGTPVAVLFTGLVDGAVTSLAAVGVVLVYRSTRILNFAQMAIGGAGAQLAFQMIRYERAVPFVVDLLIALAVGAIVAVAFELLMRRFTTAPRLLVMVFTVLMAYVLSAVVGPGLLRLPFLPPISERPLQQILGVNALQPFLPFSGLRFHIGHLPVPFGFPQLAAIDIAVVGLVATGAFLLLTRTGVAIRAASENTERAVLLGISVTALGTLVWAVSGALAAASSLSAGLVGNAGASYVFDPTNLLPPLAAAALGRFQSLPRTVAAAIGIEVLLDSVSYGLPTQSPAWTTGGIFVVITVALFLQRGGSLRLERAAASWRMVAEPRPIPPEMVGLGIVRGTRYTFIALALGAIAFYPYMVNTRLVVIGSDIAVFGIVALSIVVLTGWAGQVSLGQYAFVGIGAVVASGLVAHTGVPFWFAVPISVVVVGVVAVIVGLPALRLPGLYLAVVSLSFGAAVYAVLFDPAVFGWLLTSTVARPTLFFLNFDDERSMYYLCLAAFVVTVLVSLNLRRGRTGRLLIALRENDSDVQTLGIPVVRSKLLAFAISGGMAGFAGALSAFVLRGAPQGDFSPTQSIQIFIYALLGGVSSVTGGLIGAAILELIVYFLTTNVVLLYVAGLAPLLILYLAPSGLLAVFINARDSLLRIIAHRRQMVVPSLQPELDLEALEGRLLPLAPPLATGGLGALAPDERFALRSRLFRSGAGRTEVGAGQTGGQS